MKASQRDEGPTASFHSSKPTLTLDTNPSSNLTIHNNPAQSAPVGTRQEKGIPPMYQATDRYCAKLEEMMSSPTWRSQNPGPHIPKNVTIPSRKMGNNDDQRQSSSDFEDATLNQGLQKDIHHASRVSVQRTQSLYNDQPGADSIHLGHASEPIKIHSIHPFPAIPHTPTKTFIIAASVSRDVARPQGNPSGQMKGVNAPEVRYNSEGENAEKPGILDTAQQHDVMGDVEKSIRDSFVARISPDGARADWEAQIKQLDDFVQLMKRDQAIESINHWARSPYRRRQASPDGEQRFRGLIERLKTQEQIEQKPANDALLRDPAIVQIGPSTPTDRRKHAHSDSGYGSGVASKPSTRAQSRATNGTSDSTGSEALSVQHRSSGSNDSGAESLSKNSSLNPAAQEFSLAKSRHSSPHKTGCLPRPDASKPFLPQHQGMTFSFSPLQVGTPSHQSTGPWYPPLVDDNALLPTTGFTPMQQGALPIFPGCPNVYPGAMMPPPTGTNPPRLPPALPSFPGISPGMAPPLGLGLSGIAQPPSLTAPSLTAPSLTAPSLTAPSLAGPFHQQLPYTISCNNPNHHTIGPFGAQPPTAATPMDGTPQNAATSMHQHAGPPHFIPKHVPKPKVPDRDLQQNWELVHELRRMHEPGYAQKCKEKQRKRFMKQLEKRSQL